MPAQTLEQVERKQTALKKTVAELGEGAEPSKRRALKKRLRRAQRKSRKMKAAAGAEPAQASAAE